MRIAYLLLTSCLTAGIATGAMASERYATRPPVVMSPDLSAPWVMQLRARPVGSPVNPRNYVVFSEPPARGYTKQRNRKVAPAAGNPAVREVSFQRPEPPANDRQPKKRAMDPEFLPQTVAYDGPEKPGTIVIDTSQRFLFLVEAGGTAQRYGVGVGKEGFGWSGTNTISRKAEWPDWNPPASMIERERQKGRIHTSAYGRRYRQSSWCTRALSRLDPVSHSRHQCSLDHWPCRIQWLHSHAQRRRHGPLRARQCRYQGYCEIAVLGARHRGRCRELGSGSIGTAALFYSACKNAGAAIPSGLGPP